MIRRRKLLGGLGLLAFAALRPAWALTAEHLTPPVQGMLNGEQSDRFRAWMSFIVSDQMRRGPSPRWFHRDCAGLVRFAVAEALRVHDTRWRRANGFEGRRLPPEIDLQPEQARLIAGWTSLEGKREAFVTALPLVQNNSRFLGREISQARPGDLLFFDQGDEQHLMIWLGNAIAYHNGQTPPTPPAAGRPGKRPATPDTPEDNGLRVVTPAQLLQWKDTRWRPREDNPNFTGFYRLAFLSR